MAYVPRTKNPLAKWVVRGCFSILKHREIAVYQQVSLPLKRLPRANSSQASSHLPENRVVFHLTSF